ncbi:MAG: hypothetical protein Q8L48_32765 [Archangium sp.]|nr:hypothetical protein [Archangium sp.]
MSTVPDRPRAFGYKCWWLAVRAGSAAEVVDALVAVGGVKRAVLCNWESGFARTFGAIGSRVVFITPPVKGWCFVLSQSLEGEPGGLRVLAKGCAEHESGVLHHARLTFPLSGWRWSPTPAFHVAA